MVFLGTWINTGEIPNNSIDDDKNGYIDDWKGWDWVNHDNNPGWEENDKIDHHGTFITGLIAANDDSIIGVAPNTTIMALRVVDQDTLIPNPDALASAVDYAIENGADVIIMSLNLFIGPPGFRDSIREAFDKGIPTVAVAGNSDFGNESIVLPGSFSEVITVGASNINHEKADYSNIGGELDLIAPGGDRTTMELKSSDIGGGYRYGFGTSYAAPHVAGVISLIKSIRSDLGVENIRYILHTTATDIGPIGWDKETGYGILNAAAALELASIFSPTTTIPKTFWIFGTGSSNLLEFIGLITLALVYINRKRNKDP
ncbi:MAG: S8 family peptidase [Candidatus Hodarchaeales archaeon]